MDARPAFSKKLDAVTSFLDKDSTTIGQVESLLELLKGVDPRVDDKLKLLAKSFSQLKNLLEGDVIELSAEYLPERTEKEKRRKKALLFFIRNWKLLKSEVERAKSQIKSKEDLSVNDVGQILAKLKGPFGIITVVAVVLVIAAILFTFNKPKEQKAPVADNSPEVSKTSGIKYIEYTGKKIPLDEVVVKNGPDCNAAHYHARNTVSVKTVDGEIIPDPGACAFGKVSETKIIEL